MKDLMKKLMSLPTQLTITDKSASFRVNEKTLECGTVVKAPIIVELSLIEGLTLTEKKVGKSRKCFEYIGGKYQQSVHQPVKCTVRWAQG